MAKPDGKVSDLREQFDRDVNADRDNREMQLDDLSAYVGEGQWDEDDRRQREVEDRPTLEMNQLPKFARQTIGDIRESEPSIKITPEGDGADEDTAKVYNGLVRLAQKRAAATKPFIKATENAIISGIGHFRITADYLRDNPFHQEIGIEAIHNPLAVVWDGDAREVTRSDAHHCYVREAMTRTAFKRKYKSATLDDFSGDEHDVSGLAWSTKETVTVAEYFEVGTEKAPYALLEDGSVIRLDRLTDRNKHDELNNAIIDVMTGQSMPIVNIKEADARKVTWKKMSGFEILEERDWLTGDIPIIAVVGEQIHFHDRVMRVSLIRYAKAAQKIYNYGVNAQLEMAMNAPKSPYILGTTQIPEGKGVELWAEANKGNKPYLIYNDSKNDRRPQREQPPQVSSAMQVIIAQAGEDLKAGTGIYDAALGAQSNETSGVAIRQRQQEADVGTNLFADNLEASLTHAGQVMIDLIPRIYDSERRLKISGEDGGETEVEINKRRTEAGQTVVVNDLTVGRYTLAVNIGPSATTKRQEALQAMERILQGAPDMLAQFFDLWVEKMDFPGSEQFVERARKLLPPGLIEDDATDQAQGQQDPNNPQGPPVDPAQAVMQQQQEMQMQAAQQAMEAQSAQNTAQTEKAQADAKKSMTDALKSQLQAQAEAVKLAIETGTFTPAMNAQVTTMVSQVMALSQEPTPAPSQETPNGQGNNGL